MTIGENLKRLRMAAGLSQARLAKSSGVTQQLISQIESGTNSSTKSLPALAAAIGCKVSEIDPNYEDVTVSGTSFAVPVIALDVAARLARQGKGVLADHDLRRITVDGLPEGDWVAVNVLDEALDRVAPEGSTLIANLRDTDLERDRFYLFYDEDQGTVFCRRYHDDPPMLEPYSVRHHFRPLALRPTIRPIAKVGMVVTRV